MNRIFFVVIGLLFILISCSKNDANRNTFNAKVIGKGIDCGNSYLLKFNDDVFGLPENVFDNVFYEINLPEEFKVDGKEIYVEFREPDNDEIMVCTMAGPGYPQVVITKVE